MTKIIFVCTNLEQCPEWKPRQKDIYSCIYDETLRQDVKYCHNEKLIKEELKYVYEKVFGK